MFSVGCVFGRELDKEIRHEIFHNKDVYETVTLNNKEFFKADVVFKYDHHHNRDIIKELFIPISEFKSKDKFQPVDKSGNIISDVKCLFDAQGSCSIELDQRYYKKTEFTPAILFHKGAKKTDVNKRLIRSLSGSVADIRSAFSKIKVEVEEKLGDYQNNLDSVFVCQDDINFAVEGIEEQLHSLQIRIKDCERLEALCK
ncbi:hypothetical protein [Endozoicomonas sp. YOMI1]|uniref:hypothetical protein n=1 Tax=Endozoicomonas sp. YOMI1 TaxID=2828739 RepID=UPI002148C073|nr:hypothetical protein [Endozoicomonas sp. YOMI1]